MSAHLERHPDALVDEDQDAAEEGTAAAWAAESVINGDATSPDDMVGRVHRNGVEIDEDMARHLTGYVAIARSLHHARAEVFRSVQISPEWMVGGTLDLEGWSSPEDYHVVDLKYGFRVIEPTTDQIWSYASLALAHGNSAVRFHLTIYQPRAVHHAGPFRTLTATREQIEAYRDRMFARAIQIAAGAGDASPTEYCAHCLGAAKCEALTHTIYAMWTPVRSRAILDPSDQQISDELAMLKQMQAMTDARRVAVEAEATERLRRGKMIPGWAMMPRPGQRKFKYPGDVVRRPLRNQGLHAGGTGTSRRKEGDGRRAVDDADGRLQAGTLRPPCRCGTFWRNEAMTTEADIEAEIVAKGKTAPRLTPSLIDAAIDREHYWNPPGTTLTVCVLVLQNGFCVSGESAAASPENFDEEIGAKIARDNARNKIWSLEGYLLRQKLYEADNADV
jgi:hypothetical protein